MIQTIVTMSANTVAKRNTENDMIVMKVKIPEGERKRRSTSDTIDPTATRTGIRDIEGTTVDLANVIATTNMENDEMITESDMTVLTVPIKIWQG